MKRYRQLRQYHFSRETLPDVKGFTIIAASGGQPAIGYLNFDNLQFNQAVSSNLDFGNLFAQYKVTTVVTYLTPMYQETISSNNNVGYSTSTGLRITRVNTKFLNGPFGIKTASKDQLEELAQIQSKSVSNYASHRSLKLVTRYPRVNKRGLVDATGTEVDTNEPMPWLSVKNQSDIPLKHNSLIFAERTDGGDVTADWKYRVVHKFYFKCSQVG